MYCVIQRVQNKKVNFHGKGKEIKIDSYTWSIGGVSQTTYSYKYEGEFERSIKDSYKISIHKSYRDNGKVKKKQWVICTIGYYEIVDGWTWIGDHTIRLKDKCEKIGISEDMLCDLVYAKLDPLIEQVKAEYETTEEYRVSKRNDEIIKKYLNDKESFENKYGPQTYDYCYDVFGVLRNEEYFKKLKSNYETKQHYSNSSYYSNFYSNYKEDNYDFSSYFKNNDSTYTEEEKEYLKVIYKAGAMKLHPDIKKDNGEGMKLLNKLKDEWGI